ncbi:FixH family protein [Paraglaciecola sp. MB-3u-78]|uniref:FixH family protein n=1 Tax=Paraglaciecola sp. MB-3u-78 TaxID=2058332 RepID=UPI000C348AC1|nr:FixH family protein [Paraglaciecola sp. MB-3u-78]PKG99488.1 nitrogen fixation protein FixH [Paraglaciecola sp. MB-3u-78]
MQSDIPKVWYKQFWPWFLIIVPLTSMVLSFTMMNLAFTGEDSMVIDDYYKEGRAINLKIKKLEQAKILNISTKTQVFSDYVEVIFISGEPENGEALTLDFFHSTQKFKDFSVTLFRDANGVYRAPLTGDVLGKWQLSLHPFNENWKIQKVVSLPQTNPFDLNP